MPPKRAPEPKDAKECMLQIGKFNNVVAWNLEMRSLTVTAYGSSALFLTTILGLVIFLSKTHLDQTEAVRSAHAEQKQLHASERAGSYLI